MADSMLDDLRSAGVLGNTSVSPDGKDLLSAPPPAAVPLGAQIAKFASAVAASALPTLDLARGTAVLVLRNMISEADTANAEEMADILEDTQEECTKHGEVLKVLSPKAGTSGAPGSGLEADAIWLHVFVRFAATEAAVACARELHGKAFDGRAVAAIDLRTHSVA